MVNHEPPDDIDRWLGMCELKDVAYPFTQRSLEVVVICSASTFSVLILYFLRFDVALATQPVFDNSLAL